MDHVLHFHATCIPACLHRTSSDTPVRKHPPYRVSFFNFHNFAQPPFHSIIGTHDLCSLSFITLIFIFSQCRFLINFNHARLIVSLSIDLTSKGDEELRQLEEKGTKGRYVSVERVMELENGNIEWRMATSSTPGGSIPSFIVESTMAKKIASVRIFLFFSFPNFVF
jgi:hypothetical protein